MKAYLRYLTLYFALLLLPGTVPAQNCTPLTSLPTLCITTAAEIDSKDNYVTGSMRIVQGTGTPAELYSGNIRIRGRGNSTWLFEKKPYRINLNTAASLLGMPATAKNWVLLANYADKTLIRNQVALETSRYLGLPYSSPFRFVDVILNGDYIGSYLLTDHMEVRENRVDIAEGQPESAPGAYLVELDGFAWLEEFIRTSQGLIATIKYPEDPGQVDYILSHINSFEARLFSAVPADGAGGYLEKVDSESLVNWYLACEITGNSDAFWSVYLHKRRSDDRFFLGPLWDFDIAFDNDDRIANARNRLMADIGHDFIFRKWIVQMRKDDHFMSAVKLRWNELKSSGFKEHILGKVNEYAGIMTSSGSQQQNYTRWPILNTKVYKEVFSAGTYEQHVGFLYQYLSDRVDWLDSEINGLPTAFNYRIQNSQSHKALSGASGGTGVIQQDFDGNDDLLWQIKPLSNGFYQIYNSGRSLALTAGARAWDQVTLTASDPGASAQQWRVTETSAGQYAIVSRDGRFGLQNKDQSSTEGAPVHEVDFAAYDSEHGEVQHWLAGSSYGKWTISAAGSALPVTIARFGAAFSEGSVQLDWEVTEQENGSHFEIERSGRDGERRLIGTVFLTKAGAGKYTWVDSNPLPGLNYYRLKIVDADGSFAYSNIVSVVSERAGLSVKVFPNPSSGPSAEVYVDGNGEMGLEIYNALGVRVAVSGAVVKAGTNTVPLATAGLPPGLYFLKVSGSGRSATARFAVTE